MILYFTKRILILLLAICPSIVLNGQIWTKSFTAGGYDSNGNFLGGSEVLQLVSHKNKLFASVGYWEDINNIWYGGTNSSIGWGQINRLDNPAGNWQEDLVLGTNYLRPETLKQIIFTKDQFGNLLSSPDTVLIAAGYAPNYLTSNVKVKSFLRNDSNGTWEESLIVQGGFPAGENYSVRDIQIYNDQQTGLEYIFATVGTQGIFKGKYNPSISGKIDWISAPEYGPLEIRSLGMSVANDTLYFSSGNKLYKRIDGISATYAVAHDFSDLNTNINSAVGGIRGLTVIDNPSSNDEALLLMWCPNGQSQGIIYRLEPDGNGGFDRIYEAKLSLLVESFLVGSTANYVLGAYNEFYSYIDPISSEHIHMIGFEVNISGGGYPTWNGYYKGGLFAKRDSNGQYSIEEINGPIGINDSALVANRCYVSSPFFNEDAIYFGGFDPNSYSSKSMAWVYKKEDQTNSIDDFFEYENGVVIFPNPARNRLNMDFEVSVNNEFDIVNIFGEIVVSGSINGKNASIDISSLPPNIYIFRIATKTLKFIKID